MTGKKVPSTSLVPLPGPPPEKVPAGEPAGVALRSILAPPELVEVVSARLGEVRERIAAAGVDPESVRIVAVTKGFGPEAVAAAVAAGLSDIGENYAAELLEKVPLVPGARAHFLGAVQRNKIQKLAPVVAFWHGVSRAVEAEAIARRNQDAKILVEVDVTGLSGRTGVLLEEVPLLVAQLRRAGSNVVGLMTVGAPPGAVADRARDELRAGEAFGEVARLGRSLGLSELSMGMSGNFEQAVVQGATMVRLGTALFGPRPVRQGLQQW